MLIIYFYPFGEYDPSTFNNMEFNYQRIKNNTVIHVVNDSKERDAPLSFLDKDDRLYIVAHGNTSIVSPTSNSPEVFTPLQLAQVTAKSGLPKNFVDLRIFSCDSGVSKGNLPSFAQRFKEFMILLGYKNLKVTGYLGEVTSQRGYRLRNCVDLSFLTTKKKGIKPDSAYVNLVKSPIGIDDDIYYAASDFKNVF